MEKRGGEDGGENSPIGERGREGGAGESRFPKGAKEREGRREESPARGRDEIRRGTRRGRVEKPREGEDRRRFKG